MTGGGIIVAGAGGHAKVVVSTLVQAGLNVEAVLDDDRDKWGKSVLGIRILGPLSLMNEIGSSIAVLAIGDNRMRREIAGRFSGKEWLTALHPWAYVDQTAQIGEGTVVFAGAVIQPDVVIGQHCIINSGATIDHDCVIGDFVHIAPGVNLAGGVKVGNGAFLGIGSAALIGLSVGPWTTVGAGSVIIRDLPAGVVAAGVPARIISQKEPL